MYSPTGNRTRVFRVTGGDTYHYTIEDYWRGVPQIIYFVLLQLWKKSGSWLNNTAPDFDNFTISSENLEEIQEKVSLTCIIVMVSPVGGYGF